MAQCDQGSYQKSQAAALSRADLRRYHLIQDVVIKKVSQAGGVFSVVLEAKDAGGVYRQHGTGQAGDPAIKWGDESIMWAYCPCSLHSVAADPDQRFAGSPPKQGTVGTLLLEGDYCCRRGIQPPPDSSCLQIKWPDGLPPPGPPLSASMLVQLEKLILVGKLITSDDAWREDEIDLLGAEVVSGSALAVGEDAIEVRLTGAGMKRLGVRDALARFAPMKLSLTGKQLENGRKRSATVDLMDLTIAPRSQAFELIRGAEATIRLTPTGFSRFKVTFSPEGPEAPQPRQDVRPSRTLTIVAKAPNGHAVPDPVLDAIKERLKESEQHVVRDAATVEEAGEILEDESSDPKRSPDLVQIIGHGQPGMLSLGYYWTKRFSDGPRGPTYAINSDPDVYGVLQADLKQDAEVLLIGCSVGQGVLGDQPLIADGPTLLFDLSRLWNCKVTAPTELVTADDFDDHGMLLRNNGTVPVMSVKGLKFDVPEPPKPAPDANGARAHAGPDEKAHARANQKPARMIFRSLRRPTRVSSPFAIDEGRSDELDNLFGDEIVRPEFRAEPYMFFDLQYSSEDVKDAALVCSGRLLRVRLGDRLCHFPVKRDALRRLRALVGQVLESGHP